MFEPIQTRTYLISFDRKALEPHIYRLMSHVPIHRWDRNVHVTSLDHIQDTSFGDVYYGSAMNYHIENIACAARLDYRQREVDDRSQRLKKSSLTFEEESSISPLIDETLVDVVSPFVDSE